MGKLAAAEVAVLYPAQHPSRGSEQPRCLLRSDALRLNSFGGCLRAARRRSPAISRCCEWDAYLDGGLAALLEARRRPVHPRAWLNQLAHASAEALEASVEYLSSEEGVGKHVDWKEVVGAVAAELLSLARR